MLKTKTIVCILVITLTVTAVATSVLAVKFADLEALIRDQSDQLDEFNQTINAQKSLIDDYNQTVSDLEQQNKQGLYNLTQQVTDLNARLPIQQYDYMIYRYKENDDYVNAVKNGKTGVIDFTSTDAALAFNYALKRGNTVYVKAGFYTLYSDIVYDNKHDTQLESEGATLVCNCHKIVISGFSYEQSQNNKICGFTVFNGTVRIENSFKSEITNMIFDTCPVGIELANTYKWSECNKIDDVYFVDCTQGIVFRTKTASATSSYGNTLISRCYFNLCNNSTAITIEPQAEFTDSQMLNVRIWACPYYGQQYNQTGLHVSGSMFQSVMDGVVFESFATGNLSNAALYAVKIDTDYQTPILQTGVTFLGSWTTTIYNPENNEIQGEGIDVVFKKVNTTIPVTTSSVYSNQPTVIDMAPSTISSFKALITVTGNFNQNEIVTVRFRLASFDAEPAEGSDAVEKTFASSSSMWLSDDDMLKLMPSKDVVKAILVDAKVDSAVSDVTVSVSIFGTTIWFTM